MDVSREIIAYATEAEWLAARKRDVTSTETAALFGESPYLTEFELFHRKGGTLPTDDFAENERMRWGNRLEAAIAYGIAEDHGLIVEPFKVYMRIPELRLGSSFDFKIVGLAEGFDRDTPAREMFRQHGPGIMEVKNVDGLAFRRNWIDDGGEVEAPLQIEIQVQTQIEVSGLEWSVIAPLVGGNTPRPVIRARDAEMGALIREKVREFWVRRDDGIAPTPEWARDADTIGQLYLNNDGSHLDLSANERVFELCKAYKDAAAIEKAAGEQKKAAKAELLTIIKAAKSVAATGYRISAGTRSEVFKAYRREAGERVTITISQIPAADITATVAPYRDVRITQTAA